MISNTTERLFIVYINTLLQKNVFFPHVRNFKLIYGPFSCLINILFGSVFMIFFVIFFKNKLNFWAYALQSEHNKCWYTNLVKFRLQSMSSKIELAFEKFQNMFLS